MSNLKILAVGQVTQTGLVYKKTAGDADIVPSVQQPARFEFCGEKCTGGSNCIREKGHGNAHRCFEGSCSCKGMRSNNPAHLIPLKDEKWIRREYGSALRLQNRLYRAAKGQGTVLNDPLDPIRKFASSHNEKVLRMRGEPNPWKRAVIWASTHSRANIRILCHYMEEYEGHKVVIARDRNKIKEAAKAVGSFFA